MLYLFDGYNILHAGGFGDREELVDGLGELRRGARRARRRRLRRRRRGRGLGALEVRFASPADPLIERLAAEHRATRRCVLVSSDRAIHGTAGQETRRLSSKTFLRDLAAEQPPRARAAPGAGAPRSRMPWTPRRESVSSVCVAQSLNVSRRCLLRSSTST